MAFYKKKYITDLFGASHFQTRAGYIYSKREVGNSKHARGRWTIFNIRPKSSFDREQLKITVKRYKRTTSTPLL